MTEEESSEKKFTDKGGGRFVLCDSVSLKSRVVPTGGAYEKNSIPENLRTARSFLSYTSTHYQSLSGRLLIQLPNHHLLTPLIDFSIIEQSKILLTINKNFTLSPILTLEGDSKNKVECASPNADTNFTIAHLFLRCDSCSKRDSYKLTALTDKVKCTNCKKDLSLLHWTGRVTKSNTFPLHEITRPYSEKVLASYGFLQRKIGLWAKEERGIISYADFRNRDRPSFYAFTQAGAPAEKLPPLLDKLRKEIQIYYERPSAREISIKLSRQDTILKLNSIPDPKELETLVESLTLKGINVIAHLKDLNDKFVLHNPAISISKELNNQSPIICTACGGNDVRKVENQEGIAYHCMTCGNTIVGLKEESNDKNKTGDKKRPNDYDEKFF